MKVNVDYLGHVKALIGVERPETIDIKDGASIKDLLKLLAEEHGAAFKKNIYEPYGLDLKPNFILTVNGLLLNQLPGIGTRLKEGDRVVLMPIVSGG